MNQPSKEFDLSIGFVLRPDIEGGYVNDPHDPGGETKYGISKRAYPHLDIKNLTIEQAKDIYFADYWLLSGADKLPWPLCLVHLDAAINNGVHKANDFLQHSQRDYICYLGFRRSYYTSLNNPRYIKGWLGRLDKIKEFIEDKQKAYIDSVSM